MGGICTATYDNFMTWLGTASCDILVLQEVHHGLGRNSAQWSTEVWHVITSIHPDVRYQGVAVFIRATLANPQFIHVQEKVLGRLLHVRLELDTYSVDLIGIYQHYINMQYHRVGQRISWQKGITYGRSYPDFCRLSPKGTFYVLQVTSTVGFKMWMVLQEGGGSTIGILPLTSWSSHI